MEPEVFAGDPSPKFQEYESDPPAGAVLAVPSNWTARGRAPKVGVAVALATGAPPKEIRRSCPPFVYDA